MNFPAAESWYPLRTAKQASQWHPTARLISIQVLWQPRHGISVLTTRPREARFAVPGAGFIPRMTASGRVGIAFFLASEL